MKYLYFFNKVNNPSESLFENQNEDKLFNAKELAEKLGCSLSYIKKLRRQGKIQPEISFSRFVRYRLSTVISALKRRST